MTRRPREAETPAGPHERQARDPGRSEGGAQPGTVLRRDHAGLDRGAEVRAAEARSEAAAREEELPADLRGDPREGPALGADGGGAAARAQAKAAAEGRAEDAHRGAQAHAGRAVRAASFRRYGNFRGC